MLMQIFLDIETLPPSKNNPLVEAKFGNLKDRKYRRLALRVEYAILLAIGVKIFVDGKFELEGVFGRDRGNLMFHLDERRILRAFWKTIRRFNPDRILFIGHNILDFDLRLIWQRSIIHQIKPTAQINFARYRSSDVYDTMWQFTGWRHRISLDEVAGLLGLESSKTSEFNGGKVYDLFLEGRHQEIADYCMRDVELARQIYDYLIFAKAEKC